MEQGYDGELEGHGQDAGHDGDDEASWDEADGEGEEDDDLTSSGRSGGNLGKGGQNGHASNIGREDMDGGDFDLSTTPGTDAWWAAGEDPRYARRNGVGGRS